MIRGNGFKDLFFIIEKKMSWIGEETRPWGWFGIISEMEDCKIKRLIVNPGKRLSLQSHQHRRELWLVVKGSGIAVVGDKEIPIQTGSVVVIEKEQKHRLVHPGEEGRDVPLEIIEIQTGEYFGEDDITRYEDDFQRT